MRSPPGSRAPAQGHLLRVSALLGIAEDLSKFCPMVDQPSDLREALSCRSETPQSAAHDVLKRVLR